MYKQLCYFDQSKHVQGLYNLPDIFINENNPPPTAKNFSPKLCVLTLK